MNFIISKEEYLNAITAWNKIPNRNSVDHIIYNAIRGHDLKRGFSPVQSPNKLNNGIKPWQSFDDAMYGALCLFRGSSAIGINDPVRKERAEAAYKSRIEELNKKYGVEFTPDLIAKMKEILL